MNIIWLKPRVAQTTKGTKFGIVRESSKDLFKGREEIESRSGHAINKMSMAKAWDLNVRGREV